MNIDIKNQIAELTEKINVLNYKYYIESNSAISDYEYDKLLKKLIDLEKKYPEFALPDSPTQRVGSDIISEFNTIKHKIPLKSLENTYSENEILDWYNKCKKILKTTNIDFSVELKIDGVAISLIYENGFLKNGVTRGNGEFGDDITHNVKTIHNVPLKVSNTKLEKTSFDVRGEIFMPKKIFAQLNKERFELDIQPFANPRNAASGSLKQLDSKICAKRKLDIFIHSAGKIENVNLNSHFQFLDFIKKLGFKTNPHTKKFNNINDVIAYCKYWETHKNELTYEIDGMVIKIDNFEQQSKLGYTTKFPKWAIAFKFAPEQAISKITSVEMSVGRTGSITPVANFYPPVHLAGTMVKRATLHNEDYINELDIKLFDQVVIEKAGEIIPAVVAVKKNLRNGSEKKIIFPKTCPVCNEKIIKFDGEIKYKCINPECTAQIIKKIEHFFSKNFGVDINGGLKTVEMLVRNNLINNISDLYYLTKDQLVKLERFGEKSAENLLNSIEKSKTAPFYKLISGLGIPFTGPVAAKILTEYFNTIDEIMAADLISLVNIKGIGEKTANAIITFFDQENVQLIIQRMKNKDVCFENKLIKNSNFAGLTFVITGTLPSGRKRNELADLIIENGGNVSSSVGKNTNYLIAGDKNSKSSKSKKAQELNIPVIDEDDFFKLLNK